MRLILFFMCLLMALPAWATDEIPVESRIADAKVYRRRAQLTRHATVQVKKGDNLLIFSGLSASLLKNSLVVKGEGDGLIQSVTHRISFLKTTPRTPPYAGAARQQPTPPRTTLRSRG